MPRTWYDYHANTLPDDHTPEDEERRAFYLSILAEKKPYFMRYIYPDLMKEYNTYIKNTNVKCGMLFKMTVDQLASLPKEELTEEQQTFLKYYHTRMPVSTENSVMNRICRRVEELLNVDLRADIASTKFDTAILKSGEEYIYGQQRAIMPLYRRYCQDRKERLSKQNSNCLEPEAIKDLNDQLRLQYRTECASICSSRAQLAEILVDTFYHREGAKRFVWDICPDGLLANLCHSNGDRIIFPVRDPDGDVVFHGKRYTMMEKEWYV